MINSILRFLRQPYPEPLRSKRSWLLIASISFTVFLILFLFQPFGLYLFKSELKTLYLAGYGLITGATLIFYMHILPVLFPKLFSYKNWKVWKQVAWLSLLVLTIGFGNLTYTSWFVVQIEINWKSALVFEGFTFAVAIIPIFLTVFLNYIRLLKRNLMVANEIQGGLKTKIKEEQNNQDQILISGNNKNEEVSLVPENFYYAKSDGNYVHVAYLNEDKIKQEMLRLTLSGLLEYFTNFDKIVRCHRAYVVNCDLVENVEGNAQGLRLKLKNMESVVPVSRNYVSGIKSIT